METIRPDVPRMGMGAVAKARPAVWQAFVELAHQIMHEPSEIPNLNKELLGAHLSRRFGCAFCHLGHLDTVEAIGGEAAREQLDTPTTHRQALFDVADAVAENRLDENALARARDRGLTEAAIEDAVLVASLFGFANRMVTGLGIEYVKDRDRPSSMRLASGYRNP